MKLYHGSDVNIEKVELSKCSPFKDFGQGFYLTEDRPHANRMAVRRADYSNSTPVVNVYEFDENSLSDGSLKVKIFDTYSVEWAQYVFKNRKGEQVEKFDVVYGPVADDKVGVQIRLFIEGYISIEAFLERIKLEGGDLNFWKSNFRFFCLLQKIL